MSKKISYCPKPDRTAVDILINCTPLGSDQEDVLGLLNLKYPGKVIDLPYSRNQIPLIKTCLQNSIPNIDGKKFWKWQAEAQEEIFIKRIKGMRDE